MRVKDVDSDILIGEFNSKFAHRSDSIRIIQVGANDGYDGDPIHELILSDTRVKSCLIEPQREAFLRLIETYKSISGQDRCLFINNAITFNDEKVKLYKNMHAVGCDKHSSLMLREPDDGAYFVQDSYELVDGITFTSLLQKLDEKQFGISIDMMVMDTEGFDCHIVNQALEAKCFPQIIFFETPNLSTANDDRLNKIENGHSLLQRTIFNLKNCAYDVRRLQGNMIAVR